MQQSHAQIKDTLSSSYLPNNTTSNYKILYKTTTAKLLTLTPKKFQSQVRKTINNSKLLIPQESRWKYTNMNSSAPTIKGLIKVHEPSQPIRPVVNWRNVPAYNLAKLFSQKIRQIDPLPNTHNVENTRDLIEKLKHTLISPHFRFASLDITNLYTNIPIKETRDILLDKLEQNNTDPKQTQEQMKRFDTITSQNCYTHNGKRQIQNDGLAMGAPSSGLISEIFLQQMEHVHLARLSTKHKIIDYFRYVDDILLIFDSNHTDIQTILNDFNAIHLKLKFTAEIETDNKINYLDVTIHTEPPQTGRFPYTGNLRSPTRSYRTRLTIPPNINSQQ